MLILKVIYWYFPTCLLSGLYIVATEKAKGSSKAIYTGSVFTLLA
jgi:hypothetical protein